MDSVPAPAERQHVGVLTVLAALVLVAFLALMAWLQYGGSRVEDVAEPERALALIVGRTLELDAAVERAPAWERRLYRVMLSEPVEDLEEGIRWYEELAGASFDPAVDLHLAILEGEAGRLERVRRRTEEWDRRPEPLPTFARLLAGAYLGEEADEEDGPAFAEALAEALEPGWFRDQLAVRLATRAGDPALLSAATQAQRGRADRLIVRLRAFAALELALLVSGLLAVALLARRRGTLGRIGAAVLPPPWRGRAGAVVLVHGGALGVLTLGALYLYAFADAERPFAKIAIGAATNLAFVPLLFIAHRRLLRPAGLRLAEGLGLVPAPGSRGGLTLVFLSLLAAGQIGEWGMGLVAPWLGVSSHWTEWFDRDLAWGSTAVAGLTLFDTIVLTPVLEEIVFRGLLFATLRRRFGVGAAAVLSAAIFAVAHGYGAVGFAAVFWSGLLWAWAYERTGSLLPSIASHAADNFMASLSVILVLRG